MNIFETILFTVILISYPLLVYTFYLAYNKNIGKEENQLFLDFSLITSFYFVIKFSNNNYSSFQQLADMGEHSEFHRCPTDICPDIKLIH